MENAESVAALALVRISQVHLLAPPNVATAGSAQVVSQKCQRQRVATHLLGSGPQLGVLALHSETAQQRGACVRSEMLQIPLRSGLGRGVEVHDLLAGCDEAETGILGGKALQEGGKARIFEAACKRTRRVLERLD